VCLPGELTDRGRETTLALGQRLRHLYVDQLQFMPSLIADSDMIYIRATPMPRALESVQQAFTGFYPPSARTADFPPPTILTRAPVDETLYPNDGGCRRFAQLTRAFADRTSKRWNDTDELKYVNKVLGKYMPESSPTVAVDGHPRLSGVMDTINATLAHGPETRLPSTFYDSRARAIIDQIVVEEWFSGYQESREYRTLGIGALLGDVVTRMVGSVEHSAGQGGEPDIKFGMSGCHDTTLAGLLAGLGAFQGEKWPPFTSHVAIELFRKADAASAEPTPRVAESTKSETKPGWWDTLFGGFKKLETDAIGRKPTQDLTDKQRDKLSDYYVRLRFNDKVMKVPGCAKPGKHLEGDESFCTLVRDYSIHVDRA
jgi:acid phosphatase